MKTRTFNDAAVRGEWTFSSRAIEKLFPEMYNMGILDYVIFRKYRNDSRFKFDEPDSFYKVVIKAVTKKDKPDEFTMEDGQKITEMKLNYKALTFMESLKNSVAEEVKGLVEAVEHAKCPAFCDFETLSNEQKGFDCSLSSKVSYANLQIPLDRLSNYRLSVYDHIEAICQAIKNRLRWRRNMKGNDEAAQAIDCIIETFKTELASRIEDEFCDLQDIKNTSGYKAVSIRKLTRRHDEDEVDLKVAETRLMSKLFNYWVSINKRVKRIAIKILQNSMKFSVSGKFIRKIDKKRKQYAKDGIRYKALMEFDLDQYRGVNIKV